MTHTLKGERFGSVAWLCATALLAVTNAGAVELVRDVNASHGQRPLYASSDGVDLPSGTLLSLKDDEHGIELWFIDGETAAGTRLVRDICPGDAGGQHGSFVVINNVALFRANDCSNGIELWRSDGTTAGTYMVANIGPGTVNYGGAYGTAVINDTLIFSANDGYSGEELWRSDGTATGTYRLADIMPGPNGAGPDGFTASATHVFFYTNAAVWVTDGTSAGTHPIASVSFARNFTPVGNAMFFTANDSHGVELWRAVADGSDVQMVANINTEPVGGGNDQGSDPGGLFELHGSLIFSAFVSDGGGADVQAVPCGRNRYRSN